MSTYSSNLKIELIGTGEQVGTWGTTTNNNFSNVFEQAIVGRGTVNFPTDANVTMTYTDSVASQLARNVYLNLTSSGSLSATRDLIVPTINKNYVIQNNTTGGQSIRVITAAGTGITVPNGFTCALYVDGTNVIQASDYLPTLTIGALNVTTLDLTNLEVTNIKAKDGTASATIADSTGVMTIGSSVLTTTDINGGTIDNTVIGASTPAAGNFTTVDATDVEATNIKAKDGTASITLANSTGIASFSKATVIETTDNTNAALRITQLGSGNALLVEDSTNPDSSPYVITASGFQVTGYTESVDSIGTTAKIQLHGTTIGTAMQASFNWGNTTSPPSFSCAKSRGGSVGTRGIVVNGDPLGVFYAAGDDGTNFVTAAQITATVDGTPGTNDMPGRLIFSTTADGASSPTERMRIDNAGRVGYNATPAASGINSFNQNITGGTTSRLVRLTGVIQSDATTFVDLCQALIQTQATSFTASSVAGFAVASSTLGAGSSITNLYGFNAAGSLTTATNNYGFYSNIASGTGRWNFYANGTADNHFTGRMLISGAVASADANATPIFQIQTASDFARSRIGLFNWENNGSNSGSIVFPKSRGAAVGTFGIVSNNDFLSVLRFDGDDGTKFVRAASIHSQVDGTPGVDDMPGRISLHTTPDGSATLRERTRISSNGTLQHRNDFVTNNITVLTASYDSVSFSVSGQDTAPHNISFSTDGTRMYILGDAGNDITQYTLTTAWDITTSSSPVTFSVAGQDSAPLGFYFRNNGLQFYVVGNTNDTVFEYACSTPWSIATASYSSKSFSVAGQETGATGIFFKPDGKKMYVVGTTADTIFEYDLGTAWDVSTASYNSVSLSVSGQESAPQDLFFTNDGYKLFVIGSTGDDVNEYVLSRPWDITTAEFLGSFSVASQDNGPTGLFFKTDLSKFYMVGGTTDTVYQYSTGDSNIDLTAKTIDINGTVNVIGPMNFQDPAVFAVNNTERMVIDRAGNVGIGTTSTAGYKLVVSDGTTFSVVHAGGGASYYGAISNDPVLFINNNTERMRIDTSGNLLVGTTSKLGGGISGIDINNASGAPGITFAASGTQKAFQFLNTANSRYQGETATGYTITFVSASNGVSLANGATSWGSLSDERKKDIIEPIADAANKVATLRAVIGKYKTDEEGTRRSFLIAQDVQAVLPESVVEENGDLILQYTDTIPLLVAAIKEQQAIITDLKSRIETLESK